MAGKHDVERLKEGIRHWNGWHHRQNALGNPVDLSGADFSGANLTGANFNEVDLREVNFSGANLSGVDLNSAILIGADLSRADMRGANLIEANLNGATLIGAIMRGANMRGANFNSADLSRADMRGANLTEATLIMTTLTGADLTGAEFNRATVISAELRNANLTGAILSGVIMRGADLTKANLTEANLSMSILVNTNLSRATLVGCSIFGISAWNLNLKGAVQSDLVITDEGEAVITVDNLEIAQFIYMLLRNEKLRDVIDTLTTKSVLILGRFTPERKIVLEAIRNELRKRDYVPILFDFEKPTNRDLTETIMTLASLSRFVIVDLSDPNSSPHELMSFAKDLPSVPVIPIFCPTEEHPNPYPMFEDHLPRFSNVMSIYHYTTSKQLITSLSKKVIEPAEKKAIKIRPKRL